MQPTGGNLSDELPRRSPHEAVTILLAAPGVRIERIVSTGQASPPGFWYDQDWAEWVMVVSGAAAILFEGEAAPRDLKAGDYLSIPAHRRHRVTWTAEDGPTIWLAVRYAQSSL